MTALRTVLSLTSRVMTTKDLAARKAWGTALEQIQQEDALDKEELDKVSGGMRGSVVGDPHVCPPIVNW